MSKPLVIQTARRGVFLRQLVLEDAVPLFELIDRNRDHLSQWNESTARRYPRLSAVQKSIKKPSNPDRLRFGIWDRKVMVGSINLTPDPDFATLASIGYWMGSEYEGRGYATTATKALTLWGFSIRGFSSIIALVHRDNRASFKVLWRSGYRVLTRTSDNKTIVLKRRNHAA
jgi:ribosomal-protein-serine acetyltransferase